ncbi:DUF2933 domain-containing protein [Acaryochloris sp. CCMEE 5410]|uniref:DUF2933 domain-containing protein n=1 Tax=Acaryochloris sp. CCMEE 5410 TaxID=310037 RepID=UPI00024841A6|nr:DUF2933 domain-containing protein [Acaryochloris sp. CCMEE 5410]KAI9129953.1 DUF2933 domain-containing protein [Acaryochloris sp. CCMEE 5410]
MAQHFRWRWRSPVGIALLVCLGVATFLVVTKAPALSWLFLLVCPLMHLFMHGGHGGHSGQGNQEESDRD